MNGTGERPGNDRGDVHARLPRRAILRAGAAAGAGWLGAKPRPVAAANDFNPYVLKSVEFIAKHRAGGGYDLQRAFTQDLKYGSGVVRATRPLGAAPNPTMCVAAVAEVIIEALNIYAADTGDQSPFTKLGVNGWNTGTITSVKAWIFMYKGTHSRGTAHALQRFGIGTEKQFTALRAGDFINLNRANKTGHAAVFLGYLDKNSRITSTYDASIVGFRYFSAQGKGKPDAGFAYRHAYFDGWCPPASVGAPRDCGIIRSTGQTYLNCGSMAHPDRWQVSPSVGKIAAAVRSGMEGLLGGSRPAEIGAAIRQELGRELEPDLERFNGETLD